MMVTSIGLPLLIVNGKFKNLKTMTVEDFETFIPFLVKCSIKRAGALVINGIPEWWSSIIPCQFPLQKPIGLSQEGYRKHLLSIVCQCYWYHNAQYLLPFSAEIARRPETVFFKNNKDNTTSVYYVDSSSQIMKFNNENKNYDMPAKSGKSFRRSLLPSLPKKTLFIPDIYLCENCDAEFSSFSDILKHEKICYEIIIEDTSTNITSVNESYATSHDHEDSMSGSEIEIIDHITPSSVAAGRKNEIMNYLGLGKAPHQNLSTSQSQHLNEKNVSTSRKCFSETQAKHWVNIGNSLHKNRNVEFSSLYGRKMLQHCVKRDLIAKIEKNISYNESFCATDLNKIRGFRGNVDYKVTYRKKMRPVWCHQFTLGRKQRRERCTTLKTGLDKKSRTLLKSCKSVKIVLKRLILH